MIKTRIINADDEDGFNKAAAAIKNGKLVAFPTETVYGLGANAFDSRAVERIFEAKGRPNDNPLIVHISNIDYLNNLVIEIPSNAKKLIENFWPGPLTLVLKKSGMVPDIITAGLDTVAVRMPDNPVALKLIETSVYLLPPPVQSFESPAPLQPCTWQRIWQEN